MVTGDEVEVNLAVFGGAEVQFEWLAGYEYVGEQGSIIAVRRIAGALAGTMAAYPSYRVRFRRRWTWAEVVADARAAFGKVELPSR